MEATDRLPLSDHPQLYRAIGLELSEPLDLSFKWMQEVGGADVEDRTMIEALKPALEALVSGLDASAKAARSGADATARMKHAKAGRSSYLNELQLTGHTDPGTEAVARPLKGLAEFFVANSSGA